MTSGLVWSLLATACGVAGSLLITPMMLHVIGPAEYGLYILVITVTSYASFLDLGLTWAATRYFANDIAAGSRDRLASRLHTLASLFCGISFVIMVIAIGGGPLLLRAAGATGSERLPLVFALAALSFSVSLQTGLVLSLLAAAQRFATVGQIATLGSVLLPLLSYAAIQWTGDLTWLLAANLTVSVVALLVARGCAASTLRGGQVAAMWQTALLKEMMVFGGWSSTGRVIMVVMMQVDRLAVAFLGTIASVAFYAVPANLASRVNVLGGASGNLFFSRASRLQAGNDLTELRRQQDQARRFLTWSTIAIALPLAVLGRPFLQFWIGSEMAAQGAPILIPLVFAYGLMAVSSADSAAVSALGRPDLTVKAMLVWAVVGIAELSWFGSSLGPTGIAYAVATWLSGLALSNIAISWWARSDGHRRLAPISIGGVLLVTLITVTTGVVLRAMLDSLASVLVGMAVLGAIALLTGFWTVLSGADRQLARRRLAFVRPRMQTLSPDLAGDSHVIG
jgi:O-antigen/teichoic acid export membrane protein